MRKKETRDWYDRLYFSSARNRLTKKEAKLLFFIGCAILVCIVALLNLYDLSRTVLIYISTIAGLQTLLMLLYFPVMWCWTYRCTNMMLSPEGNGRWSMHMGTGVSLCPQYYARVMCDNPNFMDEGRLVIARAAEAIGFDGTIILEGHLHGEQSIRQARAQRMKAELPGWTVTDASTTKTLGQRYARSLSRHRDAYLYASWRHRKAPFSKDRVLGVIELKAPPRAR